MKYFFRDKVVWITGASSGIGEHLAYALAEYDVQLILSSRNKRELERVKSNCLKNKNIMVLPLDITHYENMQSTVKKVISKFQSIDLIIHSAGISQRSLIKDTIFAVDEKLIATNYWGPVALTKEILPHMIRKGNGQIVVISSVLGKISLPYRSGYAASKHALHGYFNALRAEMQDHHIKVTIICPGYVRTNVTINALTGDGSKHNKMSIATYAGMPPDVFAKKALRVIHQGKDEVHIGGKELYAIYLKNLFPRLFSHLIRSNYQFQKVK